jgi:transcriptional regulator GlxA family with amidase domain
MKKTPPRRASTNDAIGIIAFDGISPFHLSVPCLVFGEDRRDDGIPLPRIHICAERPGRLRTTTGFSIEVSEGLDRLSEVGTVIVPSWRSPDEPASEQLLNALRRAHRRGAKILGLCLGAFVVAQAGLLDGRRATTHWRSANTFSLRFPDVKFDPDVLYVEDGNVLTSAGTVASLDCCLHLLRDRIGADLANHVARRLVVSPHRQGGQAQFIEQPVPARADGDRMSEALDWAQRNLDQPLGLDHVAERALMSRRTFTRHFRERTGTTFNKWRNSQRVAYAQRLLETTDLSIEDIACATGFGSALSLRLHFAENLRTSPSAYRREFRGPVL